MVEQTITSLGPTDSLVPRRINRVCQHGWEKCEVCSVDYTDGKVFSVNVPISTEQKAHMTAAEILAQAQKLVANNRQQVYGDKLENHQNIAEFWNAYLLRSKIVDKKAALNALDVANMMELLKIARRLAGAYNLDNYIDGAGYAACAGEIAERIMK